MSKVIILANKRADIPRALLRDKLVQYRRPEAAFKSPVPAQGKVIVLRDVRQSVYVSMERRLSDRGRQVCFLEDKQNLTARVVELLAEINKNKETRHWIEASGQELYLIHPNTKPRKVKTEKRKAPLCGFVPFLQFILVTENTLRSQKNQAVLENITATTLETMALESMAIILENTLNLLSLRQARFVLLRLQGCSLKTVAKIIYPNCKPRYSLNLSREIRRAITTRQRSRSISYKALCNQETTVQKLFRIYGRKPAK